jgi:D-alanyl-lipoteichoic acid acyltransferase DltB (MBOAT superfamily)
MVFVWILFGLIGLIFIILGAVFSFYITGYILRVFGLNSLIFGIVTVAYPALMSIMGFWRWLIVYLLFTGVIIVITVTSLKKNVRAKKLEKMP